jgi:endoglucanase
VFDPDATRVLLDVADKHLKGRHQRRIMDGGACEATAATAWGVAAIGLSVPLGNYHNQGLEGGPDCRGDNAPAPEFVHEDDITGLLRLCRGLLQPGLDWREPWKKERARLLKNARSYRHLL